jgi:hypothetical protein
VTILSGDLAGYSRPMAQDGAATIRTLQVYRTQIVGSAPGRVSAREQDSAGKSGFTGR